MAEDARARSRSEEFVRVTWFRMMIWDTPTQMMMTVRIEYRQAMVLFILKYSLLLSREFFSCNIQ